MKNEHVKRNKVISILLLLVLLGGLSLLLYPLVSDYWNSFHQSRAIAAYAEAVAELDDASCEAWREAAQNYNAALQKNQACFQPNGEEKRAYEQLLDVSGEGIMGYIEIPSINVSLPIYHGTDEEVLQIATGHIEGSSLPIGGAGTHCVISGHRGLPSARLFTDLDQLTEGELFILRVLDETLTYEVDQIRIVEPEDVSLLSIEAEKDLCTLMTCTPYGINSHRLLVRGHRIENREAADSVRITADAVQLDSRLAAPIFAAPVLLILLLWMLFNPFNKRKQGMEKE